MTLPKHVVYVSEVVQGSICFDSEESADEFIDYIENIENIEKTENIENELDRIRWEHGNCIITGRELFFPPEPFDNTLFTKPSFKKYS